MFSEPLPDGRNRQIGILGPGGQDLHAVSELDPNFDPLHHVGYGLANMLESLPRIGLEQGSVQIDPNPLLGLGFLSEFVLVGQGESSTMRHANLELGFAREGLHKGTKHTLSVNGGITLRNASDRSSSIPQPAKQ